MRSGVIYLYTFPNGKVYVGQTRRDPKIRHREHLDQQIGPTNGAFLKAYQEQGEPKYEILETHQHENVEKLIDILNERETFFINKFKATNPDYGERELFQEYFVDKNVFANSSKEDDIFVEEWYEFAEFCLQG